MINTYSFYESDVNKLNDFVLKFFEKIESEKGDFSSDFFEREFYENLVKRHRGILKNEFKEIYYAVKDWEQKDKTALFKIIRDSNEIKRICSGDIKPAKESDIPELIREKLITFFKSLYDKVLFKEIFEENYGNRKQHYHAFKRYGRNNYTLCPACGLRELHNDEEFITEQYDHYLPKDIYPLSAVNFRNLVPVCSDCNSFLVKSNNDILRHKGKVYYPFDDNHQSIQIKVDIEKDDANDLKNIEWKIDYSCEKGKEDELYSWKQIYDIESRYSLHITGNIDSWNSNLWEFMNNTESIDDIPEESKRFNSYLRSKKDRILETQTLKLVYDSNLKKAMKKQTFSVDINRSKSPLAHFCNLRTIRKD